MHQIDRRRSRRAPQGMGAAMRRDSGKQRKNKWLSGDERTSCGSREIASSTSCGVAKRGAPRQNLSTDAAANFSSSSVVRRAAYQVLQRVDQVIVAKPILPQLGPLRRREGFVTSWGDMTRCRWVRSQQPELRVGNYHSRLIPLRDPAKGGREGFS